MILGTAPVSLAVGGGAAFIGVFSVFIAAFVVLAIVTLRWAVRRDRVGRADWMRRRSAAAAGAPERHAQTNGHGPREGPHSGQHRGQPPGPADGRLKGTGQGERDARPARGRSKPGPGGAR